MPEATVLLQTHPLKTFITAGSKKRWLGKASTKGGNAKVHIRQFLATFYGLRVIPFIGPMLGRIAVKVVAHELEHLTKADFRKNKDHHDNISWVGAEPGRKRHECGRSETYKGEGTKYPWWNPRYLWSLTHLSTVNVSKAHELLRKGSAHVPYETGSLIWDMTQVQG